MSDIIKSFQWSSVFLFWALLVDVSCVLFGLGSLESEIWTRKLNVGRDARSPNKWGSQSAAALCNVVWCSLVAGGQFANMQTERVKWTGVAVWKQRDIKQRHRGNAYARAVWLMCWLPPWWKKTKKEIQTSWFSKNRIQLSDCPYCWGGNCWVFTAQELFCSHCTSMLDR